MIKGEFIDDIQSAVSEYCCDCEDYNFVVVVKITAVDGWVKAEIMEEEE